MDVGAVKGFDFKSGREDFRLPSVDAPFSALVFKIMVDPFVGKLAFARVYSGRLKKGRCYLTPPVKKGSGSTACYGCMLTIAKR